MGGADMCGCVYEFLRSNLPCFVSQGLLYGLESLVRLVWQD